MGYISDLRKKVGHAPIVMTSAGVLILNPEGQLLLQRRADNHLWGYPGGSMELEESFEECARREALEETGLNCYDLSYFTHKSGKQMHYVYEDNDEVYIAEVVFLCTHYTGELRIQKSEVEEQRFFDLDKLPQDISPVNRSVVQMLVDKSCAKPKRKIKIGSIRI